MNDSASASLGLELPQLLERMHRRFLDVVRIELMHIGVRDINPVQIMMLAAIGQQPDLAVRDLIERGYYLGSNVSYNIKNLSEGGYIERIVDEHDRRSARVRVTDKGHQVLDRLQVVSDRLSKTLLPQASDKLDYETTLRFLKRFERECSTLIETH
ncbi:MAG: winged helix-turn-helix transcriptional regulator [Proteobacteria bacterium]|nr:winged helix-turn-helix transcriptional regulator [Pseudomonadota bacterium]